MKILCKWPSRERPHKFLLAIRKYIDYQVTDKVKYLITLDSNDHLLLAYTNYCETLKSQGIKIEYIVKNVTPLDGTGKIEAVNRDMDKSGDWDIVVLASDDMICQIKGWDGILIKEMEENYQDTDGVLFHKDGFTELNTMCILGRKYFERFNYIYHPDYISLWSDNEYMDVSRQLKKETIFETVLFKHEHYSNGSQFHHTKDSLMNRTEKYYQQDKLTYEKRKESNFGLNG